MCVEPLWRACNGNCHNLTLNSGKVRYKAITRQSGRVINTRQWKTSKSAQQWAKRVEFSRERLASLDTRTLA